MNLKSERIFASGNWETCDSPMKGIRENQELLERFTVALKQIVDREALADRLATSTSIISFLHEIEVTDL